MISRVCWSASTSPAAWPTPLADVLAVADAPLEPVRALGHGRGTDLEQQRAAVAVLRAEDDGDIAL
jgi:hypothetical protein